MRRPVLAPRDQERAWLSRTLSSKRKVSIAPQVLRRDRLLGQAELLLDLIGDRYVSFGVLGAEGLGDLAHEGELLGGLRPGHDLERRRRLGGEIVAELADQHIARGPRADGRQGTGRIDLQAEPVLNQLEELARRLFVQDGLIFFGRCQPGRDDIGVVARRVEDHPEERGRPRRQIPGRAGRQRPSTGVAPGPASRR